MRKVILAGTVSVALSAVFLGGCGGGTTNMMLAERNQTTEHYYIFDMKTGADANTVIAAASRGLRQNANDIQESRGIPDGNSVPARPGRFKVVNPLQGSQIGALAAMSGAGMAALKVATCEGAAWQAMSTRDTGPHQLRITACLYPYQGGYHLDMHGVSSQQSGGSDLGAALGAAMAHAVVGDPSAWTQKAFMDTVRQVRADTGAAVSLVEGFPEIQGKPWEGERTATAK